MGNMAISTAFLTARGGLLQDYGAAVGGSAGRLVFSLVYFVALANSLPIAEFGIFATASAAGVVLSRLLAFGFVSPLYRVATVRPRLIGVYSGGFIFFAVLSLPVVAAAALAVHWAFFARDIGFAPFAVILASEVLLWRQAEVIVIVNNGMGRFASGAILVIAGTVFRAVAALAFALSGPMGLAEWTWYYLAANGLSLALALAVFYPGHRLRFRPRIYWRRLADSVAVCGAEVLFYVQNELDKLLVLSIGGPQLAGVYAIIMRLIDLTAIPIRAFTMMLVQAMMRRPELMRRLSARAGVEAGIFVLSTAGLLALAGILALFPRLLGDNVGEVAPLLLFALLAPGLRNLVEYQAELLYARGRTLRRAANLGMLAGLKAGLLYFLLTTLSGPQEILLWLNAVFAALYAVSVPMTYPALRLPAKVL
jgi:O-antigen/teichoic acid export membrane protein